MKGTRQLLTLAIVASLATPLLYGQRRVRQDEKLDYALTVEGELFSSISAGSEAEGWWRDFVEKRTISKIKDDDYCFELLTQPVFDRPQIGDRAAILTMGGISQLVQLIELPPGAETRWHGYGWEGEALFFVVQGRGRTEYHAVDTQLADLSYTWKKNTLFAIPVDHEVRHVNLDPATPARILCVVGYAINLYPYVRQEIRGGQENAAVVDDSVRRRLRAAVLARASFPGHYVEDLRSHRTVMREERGNSTAFFNLMSTVGHRTHRNVHISQLTGQKAYAHKHANQPMFLILKGAGYDMWSQAPDLETYLVSVSKELPPSSRYST